MTAEEVSLIFAEINMVYNAQHTLNVFVNIQSSTLGNITIGYDNITLLSSGILRIFGETVKVNQHKVTRMSKFYTPKDIDSISIVRHIEI